MTKFNSKTIAERQPCPMCSSSDAYFIYENPLNGEHYGVCYSCEGRRKEDNNKSYETMSETVETLDSNLKDPRTLKDIDVTARGIAPETYEHWGVKAEVEDDKIVGIVYPYHHRKERQKLIRQKIRKEGKQFPQLSLYPEAKNDIGLFGLHLFGPRSAPKCTITEGEDDAMAVWEMMGDFPVFSIPNGRSSNLDEETHEFLDTFDEIIICFDADKQGTEAAEKWARAFPRKAKVVKLEGADLKDPRDYLRADKQKEFSKLWWNAKAWTPDSIIPAGDLISEVLNPKKEPYVPYPFEGLNSMLFGIHFPEVITIIAERKVGKSTFTAELEKHLLETTDYNIADFSIEDTPGRRAETLVSLSMRHPLHIPDYERPPASRIKPHAEKMLNSDRLFIYSNWGERDVDAIMSKIDYLVEVCGVKIVVIDHLHMMTSDHSDDERKKLDRLSSATAMKAVEKNIAIIQVAHKNRAGEIHGSSNIEKTTFTTINLSRNKEASTDAEKNLVEVAVIDNRRYGRTGSFHLQYNEENFGLQEVSEEMVELIQNPDEGDVDA